MMKKLFLLFLVISIIFEVKSKISANSDEEPSCNRDKVEKNSFKISQHQHDFFKQQEDDQSDRHQQQPEGYDSYVAIIKEQLSVTITSKSLLLQKQQSFKGVTNVYLNEHSLFIFQSIANNRVEDYRNNVLSINLSELTADTDLISQNICCENVDTIYRDLTQDGIHCFSVEAPNTVWQICGTSNLDQARVEQFRLQLILHIMRASGEQIHHALLIVEPLYEDLSQWCWGDQENWKHTCKSGTFQSPILIDKKEAIHKNDYEFEWNYNNRTSVNAVAKFNGKQVEIDGYFGNIELSINHENESSRYNYEAKKIKFNFAEEHSIVCGDEDQNETGKIIGEMQVYHETKDGDRAIVSFLLMDDFNALENEFIDQLDASFFRPQAGFVNELTQKPNINSIVVGGAQQFYDKSFFLYSGSESTPPCREGLIRIVMKTPIRVNAAQLTPLIANTFDGEKNPSGVARTKQPLNLRNVYYYEDQQQCDLPIESLKLQQRLLNKINTQEKIHNTHYVLEKKKKEYISFVPDLHHDPTFTSQDGLLKIEKIDPSTLDPEEIKELNNGDVIEQDVEEPKEEIVEGDKEQAEQENPDEKQEKKRKQRFYKKSRISRHRRRRRF